MKKLLSLLLIAPGMILTTACNNEPHLAPSYITSPAIKAKISKGLQGDYVGKLIVVMDDTTTHVMQNEAGTWKRQAYRDSVVNFTYSASPLTTGNSPATTHVTLHDFPIRWLARSVSDKVLREALKDYPDVPLEIDYELHGEVYMPESHNGYLRAKALPLHLDVNLGGATHKLTVEFRMVFDLSISADDPNSWRIPIIQTQVSKVLIDGKEIEVFDDAWTNAPSPSFFIHLLGEKVK